MAAPNPEFQSSLRKILTLALYASVAVGILAALMKMQQYAAGDSLLTIALSATSGVFFLSAYIPVQHSESLKPDFYATILFKVLYIGSSVMVIGILFTLLHLHGAQEMMLIGVSATSVATLVSAILFLKNPDNWQVLKRAFLSALSVLLIAGFLFLRMN
jgi:hypothetical protein